MYKESLLYSVVPVEQKTAPVTPERVLADKLEHYLRSAPEDQRTLLSDQAVREKVLKKLRETIPLLPILNRMAEVTQAEARRLGVEGGTSIRDNILNNQLASICRMAVLEARNQTLMDENAILRTKIKIDPLTELPNRRGYHEGAERAMELSRRMGMPLWCLMMDVDDFRHVNNNYGHLAGDQVLQELGRRLKDQTRASDFVARFGGEEFISLVFADEEGARGAAQRIVETIGAEPFVVRTKSGEKKLRITVSVGASRFNAEEEDQKTEMEERADRNLYLAKRDGKNRAYLEGFPASLNADADEQQNLSVEGNLAISSNS